MTCPIFILALCFTGAVGFMLGGWAGSLKCAEIAGMLAKLRYAAAYYDRSIESNGAVILARDHLRACINEADLLVGSANDAD